MMSAIESQSVLPDIVYVMLDRQSDDDFQFIKDMCSKGKVKYDVINLHDIPDYVGRPTEDPDQLLFMVGHRRNYAINKAISDGCHCFVMIDGDCIPDVDLVKTHTTSNSMGYPNMTNGRRREEKHGDKDQREVDPKLKWLRLFGNNTFHIVRDIDLLKSCSVTWSCNFSMNLPAVNIIKEMNDKYYGRSEVFNSTFLGSWGGEDSFIGVQAFHGNIFITIINDEFSAIRHIEHPRPENKYGDVAFGDYLLKEIDYLNACLQYNPLSAEFYAKNFVLASQICY